MFFMVRLYIIAGESIKPNFLLIVQDIQISSVYFASILKNLTFVLRKLSGKEAQQETRVLITYKLLKNES